MAASKESTFHLLRPVCVRLSQLSLQARAGGQVNVRELNLALTNLHDVLKQTDHLDDALCDYVLFPLLPLFRLASSQPPSVTAVALQCLRCLLEKGTAVTAKAEIATQLLVLFMNLLQKQASQLASRSVSEQQTLALCQCLETLLEKAKPSFPTTTSPGTDPRIIITGNLLADLLDIASSDQVAAARVPSLSAVRLLMSYEKRTEVVRRFLPGILSKLTKPSFTTVTTGTSYKALVANLNALRTILPSAIGQQQQGNNDSSKPKPSDALGSEKWLEENATHIKSALQNIIKLRMHRMQEVRDSLFELCRELLNGRSVSADVTTILLDGAIQLCSSNDMSKAERRLASMIKGDGNLEESFLRITASTLRNLPTDMQSADMTRHGTAVGKAQACLRLASELPSGLEDPSDLASEALVDCVGLLESSREESKIAIASSNELVIEKDMDIHTSEVFSVQAGVQEDADLLKNLVHTIMSSRFAPALLDHLSDSEAISGNGELSRLWTLAVCLQKFRSDRTSSNHPTNALLEAYKDSVLSSAYDQSLALLDQAPHLSDWRLQSLALELVVSYAIEMGTDFRPELSFALYPVVERVACQNERLRRHASKALGQIAQACGYKHMQEILLQNSDYLVNAVSIKMTDLEPRPEAARVLQAAIKIGGAPLLPHLGSVLESVFSVLDLYHGYPIMVDSMFAVLGAVIEQAPLIQRGKKDEKSVLQRSEPPTAAIVIQRVSQHGTLRECDSSNDSNVFSREDIAETKSLLTKTSTSEDTDKDRNIGNSALANTSDKSERTIMSLVARIVRHSQNFLTHASPSIRLGLLSQVLSRGLAVIGHEDDTLLPVINDIWPVLISRIYDKESYISVAALETLSTTVSAAGDFMTSRIEDEWERMQDFAQKHRPKDVREDNDQKDVGARKAAAQQNDEACNTGLDNVLIGRTSDRKNQSVERQAGDLKFTASRRIWNAFIGAAVAIITHVHVTAQMEANIFALFAQYVEEEYGRVEEDDKKFSPRDSVTNLRRALGQLNPDLYWLVQYKRSENTQRYETNDLKSRGSVGSKLAPPKLHGYRFAPLPT